MTAPFVQSAHHPSLLAALAWKRRHIKEVVESFSDHDKSRSHVPSGWSPLSLVRHLTIDVETFWFSAVMAGEPDAVAYFEEIDHSGWDAPIEGNPEAIMADYSAAALRSDDIIARSAPDAVPRWWPTGMTGGAPQDMTDVLVHVLLDTATHAGHLDIVRERIDGAQFLVVS